MVFCIDLSLISLCFIENLILGYIQMGKSFLLATSPQDLSTGSFLCLSLCHATIPLLSSGDRISKAFYSATGGNSMQDSSCSL